MGKSLKITSCSFFLPQTHCQYYRLEIWMSLHSWFDIHRCQKLIFQEISNQLLKYPNKKMVTGLSGRGLHPFIINKRLESIFKMFLFTWTFFYADFFFCELTTHFPCACCTAFGILYPLL
jgi:hypothetical protein